MSITLGRFSVEGTADPPGMGLVAKIRDPWQGELTVGRPLGLSWDPELTPTGPQSLSPPTSPLEPETMPLLKGFLEFRPAPGATPLFLIRTGLHPLVQERAPTHTG